MNNPHSSPALVFRSLLCVFFFVTALLIHGGRAQTNTSAITDPTEVQALNAIFRKWNISSSMSALPWNTSGDICSGNPVYAPALVKTQPEKYSFNPSIFCDCTYNGGSTCHIIRLTATNLSIVGTIPEELRYLLKLDNLQIAENYLTGPLPPFIGNFTAMKYLSIGKNALSGPLPKELGKLQNLISLGLGMNNFSGSLPQELGNLTSITQIYIDSMGVIGEIPPTFGKLVKLKTLWASDNNFGGKVPQFLGNLTKLETLRLQGNSFQGPIPSNLANLTSLQELRLGDLSNGTSSLAFVGNLKSLATLILREAKISDTIPFNIRELVNLTYLDLSFNNLSGTLPPALFTMNLVTLYLGNNSLSGSLPDQKSRNLLSIDLSYNQLSGSIPAWAAQDNLQLNLVANNFVIDVSNSVLPAGLECLQRDIPCYRGSPTYYSFAINCGGVETLSIDGTDYESDTKNITTASYYVTDIKRWAVSSTGSFVESTNPMYKATTLSSINDTSDPKLFQAARLSPSSLRYYGLGLENGNYSIVLQFAEIALLDDGIFKSSGRRVFNIYVQGNLVEEDFDIKKEAGGIPNRAIKRNYTASVSDNFLEIHFFWAGKGSCCLPMQGYYGPLISAISVTPNFIPTVSNHPPTDNSKKKRTIGLIVGIVVGVTFLFSMCVFGAFIWRRRTRHLDEDEDLHGLTEIPTGYSYAELKTATEDFKPANKLGEGGFGSVFKGVLSDGKIVAAKQLSLASRQGKRQFVTEVAVISAVKHQNLVKLLGYSYEGPKRLLVYEYLENGSLDKALFGKSSFRLDWPTRFAVCLGTARGLAYLHEGSRVRIVHRDIKPSNILLDANLNPKISDFGLAKLFDDNNTHISTRVAGTIGYLAPEYAFRGHVTEKVDTFSFGIVALEILCGRSNNDPSMGGERTYLLDWAWGLHEKERDMEMLDPLLLSFNKEEAMRVIGVAFLCTQTNPLLRPPMSRVVAMLAGDVEVGEIPGKPTYLTDWHFDDLSGQSTTMTHSSGATFGSNNMSDHLMKF